ncbi:DNA-binding LacI/PurR family transcriptional regulator [Brachybacterium aquaticum]|uniref:DNA-binding LacI/PurR family transcriptional regulator n=1 Tax=Brachybacterium aquaticum TaxID=1432564 RepID=A0A841AFV0_9MICO|nr:substrate-binding domain-containing protein [Brachybacterium aquaticum]MBB5832481.1 DNA-binding LacI/PurR family transcriptional regulator [Brachybacterium aquaticum]
MRQPFERLGAEAIELLLGIVGGEAAEPGRRVLAPTLTVRESAG